MNNETQSGRHEMGPQDLRDLADALDAISTARAHGHKILGAVVDINGSAVSVSITTEGDPYVNVLGP